MINNPEFLYGAYALVAFLHVVYAFTLRSRRRHLAEEMELLNERAKRSAE